MRSLFPHDGLSALALFAGCLFSSQATFAQLPTDQVATTRASGDQAGALKPAKQTAGLVVRSRIEYLADARFPQTFEALYIGTEFARWNRRILNGRAQDRDCVFRDGLSIHDLANGSWQATRWDKPNRDAGILAFELRRATLLWPAGFEWQKETSSEGSRVQTVTVHRAADSALGSSADGSAESGADSTVNAPAPVHLGGLVATLGDDGLPTSVHSVNADGVLQERLLVRSWSEHEGCLWPKELSLFVGENRIWDERVETIQNRQISIVPEFFKPPSLRAKPEQQGGPQLLKLDLLGFTFKRFKLPQDSRGWDDAMAWSKARLASVTAERTAASLPHEIDPSVHFELNRKAEPIALLVRLKIPVLPAPAGWETLHDRPGVATIVQGFKFVTPVLLARLRLKRERGLGLGIPYGKVTDGPRGRRISVCQPLTR